MNSTVNTCFVLSVSLLLLQPTLAAETSALPIIEPSEFHRTGEVNGQYSSVVSNPKLRLAEMAAPNPMIDLAPQSTQQVNSEPGSLAPPVLLQLLRKSQAAEPSITGGLNLPHPLSDSPVELAQDSELPLSTAALDIAEALNIVPQLKRLHQLKHHYLVSPKYEEHVELMELRMDLLETLFSAFLDSRDTIASMDTEAAKYDAIADVMENNRDKMVRNNTVLNFASSGILQGLASSMQIGTVNALQNSGNQIEVMQAGIQALISTFALRAGKGGKTSSSIDPNTLAPVLGRAPVDYSKYPPVVWEYLNMRPTKTSKTRRDILIDHWIQVNRIQPLNKRGSAQELDPLCGTVELKKEVTIDLLRNRIPMIEDTRAVIATMVQAMREIMTFVRRP